MQKFIIDGRKKLKGTLRVSGSKNEVLKAMCAALLTNEKVVLNNVPDISDVHAMIEILRGLGAEAEYKNHTVIIRAAKLKSSTPHHEHVKKMRASIVLLGPLVARTGRAKVAYPGGDVIGPRPATTHLNGFRALGIKVKETAKGFELSGRPKGNKVVLDEMSVTATENLVMAATLARGYTEISLAATEPHVEDLCKMLVKMGATISGIGTHRIKIRGVKKLKGVTHTIIPDQLESGTFAILGALTGGIKVDGFVPEHHEVLLNKFNAMGVPYVIGAKESISFGTHKKRLKAVRIQTQPYPGFPTDLQSTFAVLMTQAAGDSEIFETMYEGRLSYVYELQKMGASINLEDNHTVKIYGPTVLTGTEITSFDIRSGATLIIAALIAKGRSTIHDIKHLDRGYEKIDEKLRAIGAKIQRVGD